MSSMPPYCDLCFEEFDTRWSINDVVNHFNKHIEKMQEKLKEELKK